MAAALRQTTTQQISLMGSQSLQTRPRVVVASGTRGTGVTTVARHVKAAAPSLDVIDAGAHWADVSEACAQGFACMVVVTTPDIVAMSAAYALLKLMRDRYPTAVIDVLVNRSEAPAALNAYERIQVAVSQFLHGTVGYAGAVPDGNYPIGLEAVLTIRDLGARLGAALGQTSELSMTGVAERRLLQ